jgi:hypothetical protein
MKMRNTIPRCLLLLIVRLAVFIRQAFMLPRMIKLAVLANAVATDEAIPATCVQYPEVEMHHKYMCRIGIKAIHFILLTIAILFCSKTFSQNLSESTSVKKIDPPRLILQDVSDWFNFVCGENQVVANPGLNTKTVRLINTKTRKIQVLGNGQAIDCNPHGDLVLLARPISVKNPGLNPLRYHLILINTKTLKKTPIGKFNRLAAQFSPNGKLLFLAGNQVDEIENSNTKLPIKVVNLKENLTDQFDEFPTIRWLPDSSHVLITANSLDALGKSTRLLSVSMPPAINDSAARLTLGQEQVRTVFSELQPRSGDTNFDIHLASELLVMLRKQPAEEKSDIQICKIFRKKILELTECNVLATVDSLGGAHVTGMNAVSFAEDGHSVVVTGINPALNFPGCAAIRVSTKNGAATCAVKAPFYPAFARSNVVLAKDFFLVNRSADGDGIDYKVDLYAHPISRY